MEPMKVSNLAGPPKVIENYTPIEYMGIKMFWTQCGKEGRLSEVRTGGLVAKGSLNFCKSRLPIIFAKHSKGHILKTIASRPSVDELWQARLELISLHQRWRKAAGQKLERCLNVKSWAGDMYVKKLPQPQNARQRAIIKAISEIQERKFK